MKKNINSYFFIRKLNLSQQVAIYLFLLFLICPIDVKSQSPNYFEMGIEEFETKPPYIEDFSNAILHFSNSIDQGEKVADSYYYRAWARIYQLDFGISTNNRLRLIDMVVSDLKAAIENDKKYTLDIFLEIVRLIQEHSFDLMVEDNDVNSYEKIMDKFGHLPPFKHDMSFSNNGYTEFWVYSDPFGRLSKSLIEYYQSKKTDNPESYLYEGKLTVSNYTKGFKKAFESYSKAIELDPSFVKAYEYRAELIIDYSTKADNDYGYHVISDRSNYLHTAKEDFEMMLLLNPNHPDAFVKKALVKLMLDEIESGCYDLNSLVEKSDRTSRQIFDLWIDKFYSFKCK